MPYPFSYPFVCASYKPLARFAPITHDANCGFSRTGKHFQITTHRGLGRLHTVEVTGSNPVLPTDDFVRDLKCKTPADGRQRPPGKTPQKGKPSGSTFLRTL